MLSPIRFGAIWTSGIRPLHWGSAVYITIGFEASNKNLNFFFLKHKTYHYYWMIINALNVPSVVGAYYIVWFTRALTIPNIILSIIIIHFAKLYYNIINVFEIKNVFWNEETAWTCDDDCETNFNNYTYSYYYEWFVTILYNTLFDYL